MIKRRGVSIIVDESFFDTFEKERKKEQIRLRKKFGIMFNLTQRNFTSILATKKFRFKIPKQSSFIINKNKKLK